MATGWTAVAAEEILEGRAAAYPWVKLHVGDPGAAGTLNAATETTRKQATWAGAVVSGDGLAWEIAFTADLDWTAVAGSEDYTHVSGWTASTAGTCGWTGQLTADAVVAGNNFKLPAGSYKLRQPIATNP